LVKKQCIFILGWLSNLPQCFEGFAWTELQKEESRSSGFPEIST
jgi:hypothetical protein